MRTTIEVTVEVEIERSPQVIWDFLADPGNLARWVDEWQSARLLEDGPMREGSVVEYVLPGNRVGTMEMVEWDPPRRSAFDGPPLRSMGGAARPRGHGELIEVTPGRTLVRSTYRPELLGVLVLLKPYFARWLRRQRTSDAHRLKEMIETEC